MRCRNILLLLVVWLLAAVSGEVAAQRKASQPEPVYLAPDEKPEFPKGNEGIQAYFANKMETQEVKERAVVTVSLVVTSTGRVSDVYIGKGISPEIDKEVLKIARSMKGWKPGKMNGKKVSARVLFPVVFEPLPSAPATVQNSVVSNNGSGEDEEEEAADDQPVYELVEYKPVFPGGESALQAFIKKHQIYPNSDKANGRTGTVIVEFIVETSGALTHLAILKTHSDVASLEAMRLIRMMPRWQPGKINGRIVRVKTRLAIPFPAP